MANKHQYYFAGYHSQLTDINSCSSRSLFRLQLPLRYIRFWLRTFYVYAQFTSCVNGVVLIKFSGLCSLLSTFYPSQISTEKITSSILMTATWKKNLPSIYIYLWSIQNAIKLKYFTSVEAVIQKIPETWNKLS